MTPRQLELLADTRMSDAARILGLHLSTLGEGDHELSFDRLAALIHGTPNADTIGKHMRQLTVHGYAERTSSGGRGSPRYRWIAESSTRENPRPEDSLPVENHGQRPLAVVVVDDADNNPPVIPPLDELTERAIEQHAQKLEGCRGALSDYLRLYVKDPRKRFSFVHLVASWLDNIDPNVWRLPDGTTLPPPDRPRALALAINDLGASSRLMKGPEGDPSNLRTKLRVHLSQRADDERSDHRNGGGNGANSGRAAAPRRAVATGPGANPNRRRGFGADDIEDAG